MTLTPFHVIQNIQNNQKNWIKVKVDKTNINKTFTGHFVWFDNDKNHLYIEQNSAKARIEVPAWTHIYFQNIEYLSLIQLSNHGLFPSQKNKGRFYFKIEVKVLEFGKKDVGLKLVKS